MTQGPVHANYSSWGNVVFQGRALRSGLPCR